MTYAGLQHTTWLGGYDFTGDSNKTSLRISYQPLDRTVYGNTARNRLAGLESDESSVDGFWDSAADAVDPTTFAALTTTQPITQSYDGTLGSVAYFYQAKSFQYRMFDKVGEIVPFSLMASNTRTPALGSVGAVRGQVVAIKQTVAATGAVGAGVLLGATSASQFLYGALHVYSAGTTITVVLESDDNASFTSATTRATLGPITAVGGTWATRVAGAITDTYYRYRVTAITGSFSIAGVAGIK
jgi:hypothetical protein